MQIAFRARPPPSPVQSSNEDTGENEAEVPPASRSAAPGHDLIRITDAAANEAVAAALPAASSAAGAMG